MNFTMFTCFFSTDSEVIYRNSDGHVIKFNILTNETEIILPNSTFVSTLFFFGKKKKKISTFD